MHLRKSFTIYAAFVVYSVINTVHLQINKDITFAVLLPQTGTASQESAVLRYIDTAYRDVLDAGLLDRATSSMRVLDTQCDMATAFKLLFDLTSSLNETLVVIGAVCSAVNKPLAEYLSFTNSWQILYTIDDTSLSDRSIYSNLVRIAPSDLSHNTVLLAFLRTYNWSRIALMMQAAADSDSRHTAIMNDLSSLLHTNGKEIITTESVLDEPKVHLENIRQKDGRIIITSFDTQPLLRMLCQAFKDGMYGYKYVWIVLGLRDTWRTTRSECSRDQIHTVLNGAFTIHTSIPDKVLRVDALSDTDRSPSSAMGHYAYDSVWLAAYSLQEMYSSEKKTLSADLMFHHRYLGMTGEVSFVNQERQGYFSLLQMQGGMLVPVADYDMLSRKTTLNLTDVTWGERKIPPLDQIIRQTLTDPHNSIIQASLLTLTCFGFVFSCVLTFINVKFRCHSYIKMSSPKMNQLIIIGCSLAYLAVLLLAVSPVDDGNGTLLAMCTIRSWVMAIAFSTSFGALFSKTWRVFIIFNSPHQRRVIKDNILFTIVGVLIIIDIVLLSIWTVVDPLQVTAQQLRTIDSDNMITTMVRHICKSDKMNAWISVFYAYKGILLVVGCYFAWKTRSVTIPALNDSKHIGMSVYNVVIMCASAVAISFISLNNPDLSLLIIGLLLIICTTVTLCIIFIPKLVRVYRDPKGIRMRPRILLSQTSSCRSQASAPDAPERSHIREEQLRTVQQAIDKSSSKLERLELLVRNLQHKIHHETSMQHETHNIPELETEESAQNLLMCKLQEPDTSPTKAWHDEL